MIRRTFLKAFFSAVVLVLLFGFAGCSLVDSGVDSDESAMERGIGAKPEKSSSGSQGNQPQPFTATIFIQQAAANTRPVGAGVRWRTTDEVLVGKVLASNLSALAGADISMDNFTNFGLTPTFEGGPYTITGTNHSTVTMALLTGEVLTFKANGKIEGFFPVEAAVDMNFVLTGRGAPIARNIRGDLTGKFNWFDYYGTPVAFGTFQLEGFYN